MTIRKTLVALGLSATLLTGSLSLSIMPVSVSAEEAVSKSDVKLSFKYVSDKFSVDKKNRKWRTLKVQFQNKSKKPVTIGIGAYYFFDTGDMGGIVDLKGTKKKPTKLAPGKKVTLTYKEELVDELTEEWFNSSYIMKKDNTIIEISIPIKWNGQLCLATYRRGGKLKSVTAVDDASETKSMVENVFNGKSYFEE